MNVTEYAYVNDKLYRLNDELLAAGVTIRALLEAGWSLDRLALRHIVPCEPTQMVRCNNPKCVECNGSLEYTEEQVEVMNQHHEIESKLGSASNVTRDLMIQLLTRDAHGKVKYGTSLDRTDLTLPAWLQHQAEELMDGAGYALAAKREAESLLRTKAAALEVCNAAQTASSLNELYAAIARLHDTL